MADETVAESTIINAPAEAIFAVLADPGRPGHRVTRQRAR